MNNMSDPSEKLACIDDLFFAAGSFQFSLPNLYTSFVVMVAQLLA